MNEYNVSRKYFLVTGSTSPAYDACSSMLACQPYRVSRTRESETSSKELLETAVELAHEPPPSVKEPLLSEEELQRRLHDVGQRRAEAAAEKPGIDAGELERKLKETIENQPDIAEEEPPKPKPRAVVREYDPDVDFVPQQPMPTVESPPSDSGTIAKRNLLAR